MSRAKLSSTIVVLTLAMSVLPQATPWRHQAVAGASPGYVLLIHATAEPHMIDEASTGNVSLDQAKSGFYNANGAVSATKHDDSLVFHAIPYRADTVLPVVVGDPRLEIEAVGSDRRLMFEPNLPSGGNICHNETSFAGHEGPLDACTVYRLPLAAFDGMTVVTLTLHFTDGTGPQQRIHNLVAHGLVHAAIGGAPVDLKAVDATITEPTPLVVQRLIETKAI
jgi:hypothetical protein